jgi:hypothetical protein
MQIRLALALVAVSAAIHPALLAQDPGRSNNQPLFQQEPRRPRGIYAVVPIEQYITTEKNTNPSISPTQLDAYFAGLYWDLIENPAVSGLALQVHWDMVNPNPPNSPKAYDWSFVDIAFADVGLWNFLNPFSARKTIQLIVSAGFETPQWAFTGIEPCDGLFEGSSPAPGGTCGSVTVMGYQEGGDGDVLPLPWNVTYQNEWKAFLTALAARYESNPAFVSIAVAGPTAATVEIILPNDANTPAQTQFGGITANKLWKQVLANAGLPYSDQAFIDAWDAAIDMYGEVFSGVTLVITTGNGLPNFAGVPVPSPPAALSPDCAFDLDLDCSAETTILGYFMEATVGGANAKATQESGMKASIVTGDLETNSVKLLSTLTAQSARASAQVLGGLQFGRPFTGSTTLDEGCTMRFPPDASDPPSLPAVCASQNGTSEADLPAECIPAVCFAPGFNPATLASGTEYGQIPAQDLILPEQAAYNVLSVYFDGTAVAASFGGTPWTPPAPLNYLQNLCPGHPICGTERPCSLTCRRGQRHFLADGARSADLGEREALFDRRAGAFHLAFSVLSDRLN